MKRTRTGFGTLTAVAVAVLVAGCGSERADEAGGGSTSAVTATPSEPVDFRCPGEDPAPEPESPVSSSAPAGVPTDHYAENHGFQVPFPLHGQSRCDGLALVTRVEQALEPLRKRGDFSPAHARKALMALGYGPGAVETHQGGATEVGFLVYAGVSPLLCVKGSMNRADTEADAFGGYPDHASCDRPRGGH
ncbi:hypothetical protein [Streptomyces sp. NPDC019224]|uniref:hypothetical protein n=1 Tax=Streptomyces sp. NPDC019224 TaxID=3154484 RepID=UPI0033D7FC80